MVAYTLLVVPCELLIAVTSMRRAPFDELFRWETPDILFED